MGQGDTLIGTLEKSGVIRAAMRHGIAHTAQQLPLVSRGRCVVQYADNSAHELILSPSLPRMNSGIKETAPTARAETRRHFILFSQCAKCAPRFGRAYRTPLE